MNNLPFINPSLLHPKSISIHQQQSQASHPSKHKNITKAQKKKFKTRIKEFNAESSNCLIDSYDSECFAQFNSISARQKNNMAARTSRKRKRMYIELLQEQNNNLQLQLYQLNEQIEMQRNEIFNAIMHTDQLNSKNGEIQILVTKKLRNLTQMQTNLQNDTEINICLDSCIYRIGASGSERRDILDILYKGFINRNLPNNYRFILWAAIHRYQIYNQQKNTPNWFDFIKSDLMKRFEDFFADKGHMLEEKGKEILKCSRKILNIKKQIQQSGQLYDRFVKEIREILTPTQSAELFLFADRATPKPQLQLFQQQDQFSQQESCVIINAAKANRMNRLQIVDKKMNAKKIIELQQDLKDDSFYD